MSERPAKLPLPAQLVVWGAEGVTMTEKAVWYHTWFLDQGREDGCYIGARSMAARLGVRERTIEDARARLRRLGLLASWTRPEGREHGYRARLPLGFAVPRTFKEATPEQSRALDRHIVAVDAGPTATPYPEPRQARTHDHGAPVPSAEGASRKGGRGEGASLAFSSSQANSQLHTAFEDAGKAEDAAVEFDLEKRGGRAVRAGDVATRLLQQLQEPAA